MYFSLLMIFLEIMKNRNLQFKHVRWACFSLFVLCFTNQDFCSRYLYTYTSIIILMRNRNRSIFVKLNFKNIKNSKQRVFSSLCFWGRCYFYIHNLNSLYIICQYLPHKTKKNTMVFTIAKDINIFHKSLPMSSKLLLSCTIIGGIKNPSAAPSWKNKVD